MLLRDVVETSNVVAARRVTFVPGAAVVPHVPCNVRLPLLSGGMPADRSNGSMMTRPSRTVLNFLPK